ncbi:potassium channel family protein [Thermodesulfobacteriota bacterium]
MDAKTDSDISSIKAMYVPFRDRIRRWMETHRWAIVAAMWGIALVLGYVGFARYHADADPPKSGWYLLYVTLQLFTVESGDVSGNAVQWELETARLLAPATTLFTLWQALAVIFQQQFQHLRMRFYSGHVVICGLGKRGLLLARAFRERGDRVVVIEQNENNPNLEQCRDHGVLVLIGNATDPEELRVARVHTARHLVVLCSDDGINAEIAVDTRQLIRGTRLEPLNCVVQISDSHLLHLLRDVELGMGTHAEAALRIEFFNVYERGARAILAEFPPFVEDQDKTPHILIVGVGRMGESLVAHAARWWREGHKNSGVRMKMTLVDRDAETKRDLLLLHYPLLEKVCAIHAIKMDVTSPAFYRGRFLLDSHGRLEVTAIYVCLDNDSRAMAASLVLLEHTRGHSVPIMVRMAHEGGLAELLEEISVTREDFGMLTPFGLLDRICTPELVLGGTYEMLARSIHEEYLLNNRVGSSTEYHEPVGERWESLSKPQKDSFRRMADQMGVQIRAIRCNIEPLTDWDSGSFEFTDEDVEAMAQMEYEYHMNEKACGRWCYSPGYHELPQDTGSTSIKWGDRPQEVREAYRNVVRKFPKFLAKADFEITRIIRNASS